MAFPDLGTSAGVGTPQYELPWLAIALVRSTSYFLECGSRTYEVRSTDRTECVEVRANLKDGGGLNTLALAIFAGPRADPSSPNFAKFIFA